MVFLNIFNCFFYKDELWNDKLKDLKKFIDNNKRLPSQSSKIKMKMNIIYLFG